LIFGPSALDFPPGARLLTGVQPPQRDPYSSPPGPPSLSPRPAPGIPTGVWVGIIIGVVGLFALVVVFVIGIVLGVRGAQASRVEGPPPASTEVAPELPKTRRGVPKHELAILDGCSPADLDLIDSRIGSAIQVGAPTYNAGDFQGCFTIYERTALNIEAALSTSCKGPAAALTQGRSNARARVKASDKAWAMRDAFDGLLDVMERAPR
jgi:hypothetical protein